MFTFVSLGQNFDLSEQKSLKIAGGYSWATSTFFFFFKYKITFEFSHLFSEWYTKINSSQEQKLHFLVEVVSVWRVIKYKTIVLR